jgi:arabinogalactan endo-1,4-beta-galactosidase
MRDRSVIMFALLAAIAGACGGGTSPANSGGGSSGNGGGSGGSVGRDAAVFDQAPDRSHLDAPMDRQMDGRSENDSAKPDAGRVDGSSANEPLPFLLGADISSMQEQLDQGARYKDTDGTEKDLLQILKGHGLNAIRVRTFVDPAAPYGYAPAPGNACSKNQPYCDVTHVLAMAKQIKAAGLYFFLDFHYSDTWADPAKQIVPRAWRNASSVKDMAALLKSYTKDVLSTLVDQGLRPDWVQVGNEITAGLCIHVPNNDTDCWGNNATTATVNGSNSNWANTAALLKAGIEGVRETDPRIKVVLHIESTGKLDTTRWWVSSALAHDVNFDILGLSCYTAFQGQPSVWKTTIEAIASEFPNLSFAIAEHSTERSASFKILRDLPDHRGLGSFAWEPTQGGSWGAAIFDYDNGVYTAQAAPFAEFETLAGDLGMN